MMTAADTRVRLLWSEVRRASRGALAIEVGGFGVRAGNRKGIFNSRLCQWRSVHWVDVDIRW